MVRTLTQVTDVLGLPSPTVSELVRGMASGGTIHEVSGEPNMRMRVQPENTALRAGPRTCFFSGPGEIDAAGAVDCLESPSIAAVPIIGAIHRGAAVGRDYVRSIVDWSDGRAAAEYALLGPVELRTALERAPRYRTRIASAAYRHGIDRGLALRVLMQQAVGDDRPENNTPEHPLRSLGDYLGSFKAGIGQRKLAVQVGSEWLREGGDVDVGVRRIDARSASRGV